MTQLLDAAEALLADVQARYPNQELSTHMRALAAAVDVPDLATFGGIAQAMRNHGKLYASVGFISIAKEFEEAADRIAALGLAEAA